MALTVQNGGLVVRDGKLGTGQGCCCETSETSCDITTRFQGQGAIDGPPDLFPELCTAAIEYVNEIKSWLLLVQEWMEDNGYKTATIFVPQTEIEPFFCDPAQSYIGATLPYSITADCCGFVPSKTHPEHGVNSGEWLAALDLLPASNVDPAYSYTVWTQFEPPMVPPCVENPLP